MKPGSTLPLVAWLVLSPLALAQAAPAQNVKQATLIAGQGEWPMPIPIVKTATGWRFDTLAGRHETLLRRIGANELDAIQVCRGFVEAQHDYASLKRDGSRVNQYAQRVISTPGKHDGLAWQNPDGTWGGPVGETIARAIAEGPKTIEIFRAMEVFDPDPSWSPVLEN